MTFSSTPIGELTEFTDRLVRARAQLAPIDRTGPCDPSCSFLGRTATGADPEPATLPTADAVSACGLDAVDREGRVRQWREVLTAVTVREAIPGGLRLTFDRSQIDLHELVDLAEAESRCCSFFDLSLHIGPPLRLDATAPDEAPVVVHELLGAPGA